MKKRASGRSAPTDFLNIRLFYLAIPSSLATLSSIGGWVLKSLVIRPPESGLTINMWAVAGSAFIGTFCEAIWSFFRALAR